MSALAWLQKFGSKGRSTREDTLFLPVSEQIKSWQKANRKMDWGITPDEFDVIEAPPVITPEYRRQGFRGTVLFYGFGNDGSGNADAVLSGRLAWEYACRRGKNKTWQCEYVDFNKPEDIRLRPGAPGRPRGFYWAQLHPGERHINLTVSQVRIKFNTSTGCAPEGFQLLAVTHAHFADLMTARKMPFMALADYDVAPHGFNDFYDAPQLFCSNHILGLGIGWTMNRKLWPDADKAAYRLGEPQKVTFKNSSSRLHPMHIHGVFFRVLERNGKKAAEPFTRDTVLVGPRESVTIGFVPEHPGIWLTHCHIQEHAEAGMMTTIDVTN